MNSQGYPLQGVRILDMATVLAGPFSATLCCDLGAEVVKLELPQGGDTLRSLAPVHDGHSLFWKTANRGKQGISLDVRKPQGRELLLRLIGDFDVLVENFRTGTMDRWGLDLATLHAHNPRLIVLRVTGFGQTGPYAQRPGFARIFEAMSGFAYLSGEAGGPPQHMNYPLGDVVAGLFGAFAIAAALAERNARPRSEQRGLEIDLSATEALLRLLDPLAAEFQFSGQARQRAGSCATYTAPSNVYQTRDGAWITVVATGDAMFARLCAAMGRGELAADPRFADNAARMRNLQALDSTVAQWCRSRSFEAVQQALSLHAIAFSKIYSAADTLQDPHFAARGSFIALQDPALGPIKAPATVPRFSGRIPPQPCVGPETGQDNARIYQSLGLDEAQLDRLRQARVI